jgi:hypothetical protein
MMISMPRGKKSVWSKDDDDYLVGDEQAKRILIKKHGKKDIRRRELYLWAQSNPPGEQVRMDKDSEDHDYYSA